MAWFDRKKPEPTMQCGWCGRPRSQVGQLISGDTPGGPLMICGDCIFVALAAMSSGDTARTEDVAFWALTSLLGNAPQPRPLLQAAALVVGGDAARLEKLAELAESYGLTNLAAELLGRIDSQTPSLALELQILQNLLDRGHFAEGLQRVERRLATQAGGEDRALLLIDRVVFRLRLDEENHPPTLEKHLQTLDEAATLLGDRAKLYIIPLGINRAECLVRLGRPREALETLQPLDPARLGASGHLFTGDARRARGDLAGAREAWWRALEVTPPTTIWWAQARRRLQETPERAL